MVKIQILIVIGFVFAMASKTLTLLICSTSMLLMVCLIHGCRCGQQVNAVGRIARLEPVTEVAVGGEAWTEAAVDVRLAVGDALRTKESGTAELEIFGHGTIRVTPGSTVRFTQGGAQGGQELGLLIENGALEASLDQASDAPLLVLDGRGGSARLESGSKAKLFIGDGEQLNLEVEVGRAKVEEGGRSSDVEAGASYRFGEERPVPTQITDADIEGGVGEGDAGDDAGDAGADAESEEMEGVPLKLGRGAKVVIRLPGEEEYSPIGKRRRLVLEPGTAVKVSRGDVQIAGPDGASVKLMDGAQGVVIGSSGARLAVRLGGGSAEASSGGGGVASLSLPGGSAETSPASYAAFKARVLSKTRSRINVTSGVAIVNSGGETKRAETGTEVTLTGDKRLSLAPMGEVRPFLPSGSAVVHDPRRMGGFTIRFQPIANCSEYLVKVQSRGKRVLEAISTRPKIALDNLGYGGYQWRASCLTPSEGSELPADERDGRVTRVGDRSGHVRLPTKAPRNALESDGRRYVVTYQNLLPAITLRWSQAPQASSYRLEVYDDASGRRVHAGSHNNPRSSFKSGFFRDGRYYWFFRANGVKGKAVSPVTKARIEFNNVLPRIHIIEPREGSAASGSVRVRGVVAVGSSVTVNGVSLQLTGDFRFDQTVPVGPGGLLVFAVATPGRGSGLYLRHLGR